MTPDLTARRLDTQTRELVGRQRLAGELLLAGLEVAFPARDRGVDLIAYGGRRSRDEPLRHTAHSDESGVAPIIPENALVRRSGEDHVLSHDWIPWRAMTLRANVETYCDRRNEVLGLVTPSLNFDLFRCAKEPAMITPEPTCPTYHEAMQQGFVLDVAYAETRAADWVEGPPRRSFWGRFVTGGVALGDQVRREIVAFRCPRCGLLQHYAP